MLSCEIGFSPMKCKHTEKRSAATTSNLHSNFPLAHDTTKSHLSPPAVGAALPHNFIHIRLISTLLPSPRKSNHWAKCAEQFITVYYSSLRKPEYVGYQNDYLCVQRKEKKLFTKNSWMVKLEAFSSSSSVSTSLGEKQRLSSFTPSF